jgi:hypothetical protein
VKVGEQEFIFVDGGMTMYNNPAFQLFLMATVEAHNLAWPTGEKEMLLVYRHWDRSEAECKSRARANEFQVLLTDWDIHRDLVPQA